MGSGHKDVRTGVPRVRLRAGLFGLALLAVISMAVWVGPSAGDNPAHANHSVTVGIDTNVTGNTALALSGSFQACRVITGTQTIDVDLYVTGLSDIASFESYIKYDTDIITIAKPGASNQGQNSRFMLQQAQPSPPGNNFTNTSEALPDTANPGEYRVGGYDTVSIPGTQDPDPIGDTHKDGVLVRLEIQGKPGLGGFTSLQISPHGPSNGLGIFIKDSSGLINVGDGGDSDVFVDNVVNGGIVVDTGNGGSCSDSDGDGVPDANDNCPATANSNQANFDGDANGDACDTDDDNDGLVDASEPGSCTGNPPPSPHAGQFDPDCDDDNVSDGANDPDSGGPIVAGPDNCISAANTNQLNTDGDSQGNACDADDDNDGVLDGADNCPLNSNPSQSNMDGDSLGDACDTEDDGDGFDDTAEAHVLTNPLDNCGSHTTSAPIFSQSWPADLFSQSGQTPNTVNKVTIQDLTAYLAPVRRFNTSPNVDANFHIRWDILPGPGLFSKHINIQDLTTLITVSPLMFNGNRAFNYATACTP